MYRTSGVNVPCTGKPARCKRRGGRTRDLRASELIWHCTPSACYGGQRLGMRSPQGNSLRPGRRPPAPNLPSTSTHLTSPPADTLAGTLAASHSSGRRATFSSLPVLCWCCHSFAAGQALRAGVDKDKVALNPRPPPPCRLAAPWSPPRLEGPRPPLTCIITNQNHCKPRRACPSPSPSPKSRPPRLAPTSPQLPTSITTTSRPLTLAFTFDLTVLFTNTF